LLRCVLLRLFLVVVDYGFDFVVDLLPRCVTLLPTLRLPLCVATLLVAVCYTFPRCPPLVDVYVAVDLRVTLRLLRLRLYVTHTFGYVVTFCAVGWLRLVTPFAICPVTVALHTPGYAFGCRWLFVWFVAYAVAVYV